MNAGQKFWRRLTAARRVLTGTFLALFALALISQTVGRVVLPALLPTQLGPTLAALGDGAVWPAGLLAAQLGLAFLFGRVYCSWLCPLGWLQNLIRRLRPAGRAGFRPGRRRRWLPPALAGLLFFAGWPFLYAWLEPYSLFARAATTLAGLTRPELALDPAGLAGLLLLLAPFFLALALSARRGFCNGFCPVGALLGLAGARAWWRPRFTAACTGCGRCEQACPAACLDAAGRRLETSRCLACHHCLAACPHQALTLSPRPAAFDPGRAAFLKTLAAGAVLYLAVILFKSGPSSARAGSLAPPAVRPPGSPRPDDLAARCTGCRACASACPVGIIVPGTATEDGQTLHLPRLDYERGFCQYTCRDCIAVCPARALRPLSLAEKQCTPLGWAQLTLPLCVVVTHGTNCGACAEHCPTGALRMAPRNDGPARPVIDPDLCLGCGACQYACPVRPRRAVLVRGLEKQTYRAGLRNAAASKIPDIDATSQIPF